MSDKILKIYYEFFFNSLELTFFKKFAIKKENALFFKSDIVLVIIMIVLIGASASGKTEAAKMLMAKYGIQKAITTTTRPMRVHEVDGRDYFFVSKEKFDQLIKEDKFVE